VVLKSTVKKKKPRPVKRLTAAGAKPPATAAFARQVLDRLESAHPEATCALHYETPFQLVVATILSAQCTDERVNRVTPALFRRYPAPAALASAGREQLEELIRPTGFFRSKAKSLMACAERLATLHGGTVPADMAALVDLPGIGRKTANIVLGHAYGLEEGVAVDTHVLRVSNRLGLALGQDPLVVESQLMAVVPRERWTRTTDLLIFHGRKICDARRPACGSCPVFGLCRWEERRAHANDTVPPDGTSPSGRPRRPARHP
jgi:endonuclease III